MYVRYWYNSSCEAMHRLLVPCVTCAEMTTVAMTVACQSKGSACDLVVNVGYLIYQNIPVVCGHRGTWAVSQKKLRGARVVQAWIGTVDLCVCPTSRVVLWWSRRFDCQVKVLRRWFKRKSISRIRTVQCYYNVFVPGVQPCSSTRIDMCRYQPRGWILK